MANMTLDMCTGLTCAILAMSMNYSAISERIIVDRDVDKHGHSIWHPGYGIVSAGGADVLFQA